MKQEFEATRRTGGTGGINIQASLSGSSRGAPEVDDADPQTARIALRRDEWLKDESGCDEETWPELKEAPDRDRLSERKLFDE
jgi:hypothetical protein